MTEGHHQEWSLQTLDCLMLLLLMMGKRVTALVVVVAVAERLWAVAVAGLGWPVTAACLLAFAAAATAA